MAEQAKNKAKRMIESDLFLKSLQDAVGDVQVFKKQVENVIQEDGAISPGLKVLDSNIDSILDEAKLEEEKIISLAVKKRDAKENGNSNDFIKEKSRRTKNFISNNAKSMSATISSANSNEQSSLIHSMMSTSELDFPPLTDVNFFERLSKFEESEELKIQVIDMFRLVQYTNKMVTDILVDKTDEKQSIIRQMYMSLFDFSQGSLIWGLREFVRRVNLYGESQVVEKLLELFAQEFYSQNFTEYNNSDHVLYIAYSTMMLNTSLNMDLMDSMSKSQYISNICDSLETSKYNRMLEIVYKNVHKLQLTNHAGEDKIMVQKRTKQLNCEVFCYFAARISVTIPQNKIGIPDIVTMSNANKRKAGIAIHRTHIRFLESTVMKKDKKMKANEVSDMCLLMHCEAKVSPKDKSSFILLQRVPETRCYYIKTKEEAKRVAKHVQMCNYLSALCTPLFNLQLLNKLTEKSFPLVLSCTMSDSMSESLEERDYKIKVYTKVIEMMTDFFMKFSLENLTDDKLLLQKHITEEIARINVYIANLKNPQILTPYLEQL